MLKNLNKFFQYVKYSGIWIGFVMNPFHWKFYIEKYHPDELNPNMYGINFNFGLIWIRFIIDNGSW